MRIKFEVDMDVDAILHPTEASIELAALRKAIEGLKAVIQPDEE